LNDGNGVVQQFLDGTNAGMLMRSGPQMGLHDLGIRTVLVELQVSTLFIDELLADRGLDGFGIWSNWCGITHKKILSIGATLVANRNIPASPVTSTQSLSDIGALLIVSSIG
jgi:hypothetical protein